MLVQALKACCCKPSCVFAVSLKSPPPGSLIRTRGIWHVGAWWTVGDCGAVAVWPKYIVRTEAPVVVKGPRQRSPPHRDVVRVVVCSDTQLGRSVPGVPPT